MTKLSTLALALALALSSGLAAAQPKKAEPKDDDKDDGFSSLAPTAENKPEETTPPEDETNENAANPYRSTVQDQQLIEDEPEDEDDDGISEEMAAMRNWKPRYASSRAGLDFDVLVSDGPPLTMTWDANVRVAFGEESTFALDLAIPWAWSDGGSAIIGNPVIGGLGGGKLADFMGLWGGFWIAIPTHPTIDAADPNEGIQLAQEITTSLVRAGIQSHRFFPLSVPLRFALGAEFQLHPLIYLRVAFEPQALIPTEGSGGNLTMDQINDIEVIAPFGLGGGFRIQEHFTLIDPTIYGSTDKAQIGFEPFISYEPPEGGPFAVPMYARLGLLMALDDPLGFGFDSNGVATLRTSIGAKF